MFSLLLKLLSTAQSNLKRVLDLIAIVVSLKYIKSIYNIRTLDLDLWMETHQKENEMESKNTNANETKNGKLLSIGLSPFLMFLLYFQTTQAK